MIEFVYAIFYFSQCLISFKMLKFNHRRLVEPKIATYIKEQTNKSMEKYLRVLLSKTNKKIYQNQIRFDTC